MALTISNKGKLIIFLTFIVFIFLLFWVMNGKTNKVCFEGKKCFFVEVSEDEDSRRRGLMFRSEMGEDEGMLFVFESSGPLVFWMKNTLLPLDIIWIDENKKIVFIHENAQPCPSSGKEDCPSIYPEVSAKYVLEVNAFSAQKAGLAVGDKVVFK